jgi:hypothetical protein
MHKLSGKIHSREDIPGDCKLMNNSVTVRTRHLLKRAILQMAIRVALSHGELVDLRIKVAWSLSSLLHKFTSSLAFDTYDIHTAVRAKVQN